MFARPRNVKYWWKNAVLQAEAGQYCTFFINHNGSISACGRGSYGRLGLGDNNNHITPKTIDIPANIVKISSSKGSDGHTLALTNDGHVYSWGDGEYTTSNEYANHSSSIGALNESYVLQATTVN